MPKDNIPGFTRDPQLASGIADQFGGGAARAEELITAVQLRQSDALIQANLLQEDVEARGEYSNADAEKVADLPKGSVRGVTKRGDYLVYVYEVDGRSGKDAVRIEDGELQEPEDGDTPERVALRARAAQANIVQDAQKEASEIIAKAQAKAAELVSKAAEEGAEEQAKVTEEGVKAIQDEQENDKKAQKAQKSSSEPSEGQRKASVKK